ncbi:unnamed protein product, partial [Meganyctiphanes norvegica]
MSKLVQNANLFRCLTDWLSLNGDCFYISTNKFLPWNMSKSFCEAKGASLVQPTTATQVQDLAGLLKAYSTYWVGASNQANTTYKWLSGDQVTVGWQKNHPRTTAPGRCVVMIAGRILRTGDMGLDFSESGLSEMLCSNYFQFICQISDTTLPNTATTTTPIKTTSTTTIQGEYIDKGSNEDDDDDEDGSEEDYQDQIEVNNKDILPSNTTKEVDGPCMRGFLCALNEPTLIVLYIASGITISVAIFAFIRCCYEQIIDYSYRYRTRKTEAEVLPLKPLDNPNKHSNNHGLHIYENC